MSNDAAIIGRIVREMTGTCRVCGCSGDSCSLPEGGCCVWMDALRTLCSAPRCAIAAGKAKRKHHWDQKRLDERARQGSFRKRGKTTKKKAA